MKNGRDNYILYCTSMTNIVVLVTNFVSSSYFNNTELAIPVNGILVRGDGLVLSIVESRAFHTIHTPTSMAR